jgi:hypothetical protein
MQFIPGTWRRWATDGNGDGETSPHNVFDAAGAAGRYLCAGGRDLTTADGLDAAILRYNNSAAYLRIVRTWMAVYERATVVVPDLAGVPALPGSPPPPAVPPGTTPPASPPGAPVPPEGTVPPGEPDEPPPTIPPTTPVTPPSPSPAPPPGDVLTGTVGGLVGGVVCVLDGATGLLGGLLGLPLTPGPGERCP